MAPYMLAHGIIKYTRLTRDGRSNGNLKPIVMSSPAPRLVQMARSCRVKILFSMPLKVMVPFMGIFLGNRFHPGCLGQDGTIYLRRMVLCMLLSYGSSKWTYAIDEVTDNKPFFSLPSTFRKYLFWFRNVILLLADNENMHPSIGNS